MDFSFFLDPGINAAAQNISPLVTSFFAQGAVADTMLWYLIIISVVYLGLHPKFGVRLAILYGLSSGLDAALKLVFHLPRPYWVSSDVTAFQTRGSFGFPSGGAINAVAMYGYICVVAKQWWIILLCIFCAVWATLGRLFAGVHFLGDILGGLLIGLVLLVLYLAAMPEIEKFARTLSRPLRITGIIAISAIPLILIFPAYLALADWQLPAAWVVMAKSQTGAGIDPLNIEFSLQISGVMLGSLLGYEFLNFCGGWDPPQDLLKRVIVVIAGTISVLLVNTAVPAIFAGTGFSALLPQVSDILSTTLIYFWLAACVPLIIKNGGFWKSTKNADTAE